MSEQMPKALSRLLQLADLLEALPPGRFDYGRWAGDDWNGKPDSCGTQACALGWAATVPEWNKEGLHVSRAGGLRHGHVFFRGFNGVGAAAAFFDISPGKAEFLFTPQECDDDECPCQNEPKNDPLYVAKKLREFVANETAGAK